MPRKIDHEKRRERIKKLIGQGKGPMEISKVMGVAKSYVANQIVFMRKKGVNIPPLKIGRTLTSKIKTKKISKTKVISLTKLEKKCVCFVIPKSVMMEIMRRTNA